MKKVLIPVLIAAALTLTVVGVGASFAQQDNGPVDSFLAKVAAKLGVSEDKLKTAVDEAYNETIDEQVAAGKLTQDHADRLKERGFDLAPTFGPRPGMRLMIGGTEVMKSAADVLGLTPEELMTQLRDGKSLAEVATAQGVGVDKLKADLLAQVKTELDTAVSDGKITQSQADEMYSRTGNNIDTIINATGPFRGGCPGGPGPGAEMTPGSSENAMPGSTVQPGSGL
jgi:polyhydroxyalkanoate synthesis regulator phasin